MKIRILTTGGTIEKTYDEHDGTLENRGTFIKELIDSKIRHPYSEIEVIPLMSKDSLFMTEEDRQFIFENIKKWMDTPIVVLHGTDTMAITAQFCLNHFKSTLQYPIVFTGAMRPIGFADTDGIQNITEALFAVKLLKPNFYISFHNEVFLAGRVQKNKDRLTFEPLEPVEKA